MQSGVQKVQQPNALNFKGLGAPTISIGANGVTHLDFPAAGANFETPVGTVDDSNVAFTVLHTPQYVIVNGATYFSGAGYTYAALTITLTNPVGVGGFIRSAY
jgi:hypothetical protein